MSDFEKSINASDLIDWIMCAFPDWCVGDVREIVDHIEEMPSAQQWIPCSERLPEEDIKVLVTDEDGDIYIAYYDYNEWSEDPKIEWWTGEYRAYPIAWMPLPEPWKGESEETE